MTKIPNRLHKYVPSMLLFLLFEAVAVTLWLTKDNFFYLLNFSYIGACLGLGTALFTAGKRYARHFVQLAVGSYMLLYLGVISRENMQIEGFWYYLFLGVFEAATIHYAVAKIFGPLLFGRGWCGYACWTAMVLDFLPYNQPQKPRKEKLGILRYVMFLLSLALVSGLFLMQVAHLEQIMFWLFLAGNTLYYLVGIVFAFLFQDNRAFCKYLCPITVFLKPMSYFSLLRVHCVHDNVLIFYSQRRILSMEYTTKGTCSRKILFEVENGKVHNVQFVGGCNGNTQGVARLVEGMDVNEAISRMKGIDCNGRGTSCPDQLAKALEQAIQK